MRTILSTGQWISMVLRRGLALLLSLIILATPAVASAQKVSEEQKQLWRNGVGGYFDYKDTDCSIGGGGSVPPGTLPTIIPEPYNGLMTKAGNTYKVSPALIAALFTEENFTAITVDKIAARWAAFPQKHPDPNSGWATNSHETMGAFQFIPDSWYGRGQPRDPSAPFDPNKTSTYGYGVDGNGDGKRDAQNFADGAAGAAHYAAANKATADTPPSTWDKFIFNYNHADWYVAAVMTYYNFYAGGGTATTVPSTPQAPTAQQVSDTAACGNTAVANINCTPDAATPGTAAPTSSSGSVAAKAVCIATAEYNLWKAGTLKPGTDFHKYSQGRNEDWCADFVSWVYNQAGYPLSSAKDGNVPAVRTVKSIGQSGGKFEWHPAGGSYTPRPGDLAIHDIIGSHVNMVVAVDGGKITMIGGNQGKSPFTNSSVTQYSATGRDGVSGWVSPAGQSI